MATLLPLSTLDDCQAVVAIQHATWGVGSETVPASVLLVSAKRGGVLIGAKHADRLVGFVWSMPGWRDGQPTHWSHMLAVVPGARGAGLGEALKRAQRAAVIAQGVALIEWTFDPLQAPNAHLNVHRLGAVGSTYLVDAYGPMTGPLHQGAPTDRVVAEWWIDRPHVLRRLAPRTGFEARSAEAVSAPLALETTATGPWLDCAVTDLDVESPRVRVPIPPRFTAMLQEAPDLARRWREASRRVFLAYLARQFRVVDFLADEAGGGAYLLATPVEPAPTGEAGPGALDGAPPPLSRRSGQCGRPPAAGRANGPRQRQPARPGPCRSPRGRSPL